MTLLRNQSETTLILTIDLFFNSFHNNVVKVFKTKMRFMYSEVIKKKIGILRQRQFQPVVGTLVGISESQGCKKVPKM